MKIALKKEKTLGNCFLEIDLMPALTCFFVCVLYDIEMGILAGVVIQVVQGEIFLALMLGIFLMFYFPILKVDKNLPFCNYFFSFSEQRKSFPENIHP